jgi:dTDP-4-amino-4,6-dideoxygalactose transaminase
LESGGEHIPFAKPFIGPEEEAAVLRVLRSGWLTTGKEALAFEEEFRRFLQDGPPGERFCLAVNSATSGLHLALEAARIGPRQAVFLPSYTFTSTAEVVRYLGAEAVFVDIAPDSYNMDPRALEAAVDAVAAGKTLGGPGTGPLRPRAVIPVHIGGFPCDMEGILAIARRRGLAVIEDAAHAFPARICMRTGEHVDQQTPHGVGPAQAAAIENAEGPAKLNAAARGNAGPAAPWAGTAGDAGVFSFYATKTITTGEGGMVVTSRKDMAERIALMRCHGIDRTIWNRYTAPGASWYYEVQAPGFKYNLPDLLAALGRVQLSRAGELLAMREAIAARYDAAFAPLEGCVLSPPGGARHLYTLRLREPEKRDPFIEALARRGIGTSVHFIPLHLMPYYRDRYGLKAEDLPQSLARFRETVSLPIWPGMTSGQVDRVIRGVIETLQNE